MKNPDSDQNTVQDSPTDPPSLDEQQPSKTKKMTKRKVNCFQQFFRTIINAAREELWTQRNKDRHQPGNKSDYSKVLKVD